MLKKELIIYNYYDLVNIMKIYKTLLFFNIIKKNHMIKIFKLIKKIICYSF